MSSNDEAKRLLAAIRAEPVPKTMSDELTESQRRILIAFEAMQQAISEKQAADIINSVEKIVQEHGEKREAKSRSFWRAVFDAGWSGVTQARAELQKLFKE